MTNLEAAIEAFDRQYRSMGMAAQRLYPNESLIRFIAGRFGNVALPDRKKIRILEVGCGSGANLWMLCKEGFDAWGMDSSSAGIDLAAVHLRKKWNVEADLRQGSFTKLPYGDLTFDAVIDVVSLQCVSLEDSRIALLEITRVLKPEGAFFSHRLSDHSVMFERSSGKRIDAATLDNIPEDDLPLNNNGPMSFWSPALARLMYQEAGLAIDSIERLGRTGADGHYVEYLAIAAVRK